MQDFKLAMMQLNFPQRNTIDENIKKMNKWIKIAAESKVNLVMFGELAVSGYLLDSSKLNPEDSGSWGHYRRAESIPGPAVKKLERISKEYDIFIAAGISDIQAGVVYNAFIIIGPDGYIGKQRKLHMPVAEYPYYGMGSEFSVFDIGLCKIGISICFDNWFPETSRILALKGAEVMLSPWMWIVPPNSTDKQKREAVAKRKNEFLKYFPARALDNAMYVLVLDHVGFEADNFELPGLSMAFDPHGDVIAESKLFDEQMIIVDIKKSEIEKYRAYGHTSDIEKLYQLKFRRPEIYHELCEPIHNK